MSVIFYLFPMTIVTIVVGLFDFSPVIFYLLSMTFATIVVGLFEFSPVIFNLTPLDGLILTLLL